MLTSKGCFSLSMMYAVNPFLRILQKLCNYGHCKSPCLVTSNLESQYRSYAIGYHLFKDKNNWLGWGGGNCILYCTYKYLVNSPPVISYAVMGL